MNHIYKVIWNTITQTWVAVSELSRAKGKTKSSKTLSAVVLAAVSAGGIVGDAEAANAVGTGNDSSLVFGKDSKAFYELENRKYFANNAVALGTSAHARASEDVAIGNEAISGAPVKFKTDEYGNFILERGQKIPVYHTSEDASVAVGTNAKAEVVATTAIGAHANALGIYSTAVGAGAKAEKANSSAFGQGAMATADYSTAIGKSAHAKEQYSIALGKESQAETGYSTSVGFKTEAKGLSSLALGSGMVPLNDITGDGKVNEDDVAKQRTIADGDGAFAAGASANATGSYASALSAESTAKGDYAFAAGAASKATANNATALGKQANATGDSAVAVGAKAQASNNYDAAFGSNATASGSYSSAFGNNSQATNADASAFGNEAKALATNATSVGPHSKVDTGATYGSALGRNASVTAANGTALGSLSSVTAANGTAVGTSATVSTAGGVALGQGSASTRAALDGKSITINSEGNVVSSVNHITDKNDSPVTDVYAPVKLINDPKVLERVKKTILGNAGAVSLGKDGETTRQLTNLAPGSADSDAVNVAQLKAVVSAFPKYSVVGENGVTVKTDPENSSDPRKWKVSIDPTYVKNLTKWQIRDTKTDGNPNTNVQNTDVTGGDVVTFQDTDTIDVERNGKTLKFHTKKNIKYFSVKSSGGGNENNDGAKGNNAIAIGKDTIARSQKTIALGNEAITDAEFSMAIGTAAHTRARSAVALGKDSRAYGENGFALGNNAISDQNSALALGPNANAMATDAIAMGKSASSAGDQSISIGVNSSVSGNKSVAIGAGATAGSQNKAVNEYISAQKDYQTKLYDYDRAFREIIAGDKATLDELRKITNSNDAINAINQIKTATSNNAKVTALITKAQLADKSKDSRDQKRNAYDIAISNEGNTVAIGSGAIANIANGIALGSESKTTKDKGEAGFDASQDADGARVNKYTNLTNNVQNVRTSTLAGLSIGDAGKTRQINHLAAGTADDDAVNVAQLKSVNLAFKGDNNTKGDVRLHDQRLSVVGAENSFITTEAIDNKLKISTTQGSFSTTTDGTSSSSKQGLVTTTAVASAINESGWEVQAKGTKVGLVNPGDKVNFTNADKSIEIDYSTEASGLSTIKFKAVTETIQTEEKSPITQIDVNGSTVSKTTKGEDKPTGRFVVPTGDKANKYALATAYDVADKVNQTGWNLYTNGGARSLINPGDYVNFKSGNATNATVVTEASEGATISYDVNVDNTTIKINPKNELTANTGDVDSVIGTEGNSKKGQVVIHKDPLEPSKTDAGKLATVDTVVKAVNNAKWFTIAKDSDDKVTGETKTNESEGTAMAAGETLGLNAGKNLRLKREANTNNFTFALDSNLKDLDSVHTKEIKLGESNNPISIKNDGDRITYTTKGGNNSDVTHKVANLEDEKHIKPTTDGNEYTVDASGNITMTYADGNNKDVTNTKAVIKGVAKNDLSNITNDGKKAITTLGSVVKAGDNVLVDEDTDAITGKKTYTVNAVTPVVYTDKQGNRVYKVKDGNGYKFTKNADGTGAVVNKSDVIASFYDGNSSATAGTMIVNNIGSAIKNVTVPADKDANNFLNKLEVATSSTGTPNAAVNVSDLHNTAEALRSNEIHIAPTKDAEGQNSATHYTYNAATKQVEMTYEDGKGNKVANKKAVIDLSSLADSVHNYGFKANATGNLEASSTAAETEVENGKTVNFDAGKNLTVKQTVDATSKNHTYSFALNNDVDLTNAGSITVGGTKVDNGGITINAATPATGETKKPDVTLTNTGLSNGDNHITNVKGNLPDTYNTTEGDKTITKKQDAPTSITKTNAATVGDVLNAGWNLQGNGNEIDFVKPYDTVNFANGTGTTATVTNMDGKTTTVKYDVAVGKGLEVDGDNKVTVKTDGDTITVGEDGKLKASLSTEKVKAATGDDNIATVTPKEGEANTEFGKKGATYEVAVTKSAVKQVAKTAVKVAAGDNVIVSSADNQAGDETTYTVEAVTPVVYTDKQGNRVYKVKDGNGYKFTKNADGTGAVVNKSDVIASFYDGNSSATAGTMIVNNIGSAIKNVTVPADKDANNFLNKLEVATSSTGTPNAAVNVSDLHNTAEALRSNEIHIAPTKDAEGQNSATHYTYNAATKQVEMTYEDGKGNKVANKKAVIDLSSLADSVHNYGFKANATGNLEASSTAAETEVENGKTVNFDAGKNLTVKQTVDATSKNHTYSFALKDDVVIGAKGENGKDGIDGSIGVNGKDGSAVAINGKDGSIGLNGKDGKNGLTIKGQDGKVGVDGKDGETRLVYVEKADPTKPGSTDKTHKLATLDDGMKYGGDIGEVANVKLNKQVDIKGGVTDKTKLSDNNIGVVSTPNATTGGTELTVKLAKELKGLTSAEFNDGKDKTKTEITHNGIAITPVNPENGKTSVTLTDKGLNNGGNTITNVAEGKNGTDAVNVNQLNKVEAKINEGGLTFAGNSGTPHKANLNTTVNIKGGKDNTDATQFDDGKNVMTTVNKNTVTVAIKKTPEVEGINIIDKDGKVKVKLTQTNEGLKVSDGNDKETRITNVAEGKNGTDAVNVKQLNAAKTEVTAGDNIDVVSRTGANGQTIYKVSAKGINDTSAAVKAGSNHVEVTKAANTHKDGSTTVTDYTVDLSKETKEDIKKGVDAHTEVTTKGLTFNADHGTTGVKKLGSKVAVNGDGKNITTTADENGVKVSMKDDIKVNSVTAKEVKVGDVNINENGINAGGKRITNVAPGKDGTDAVNVNQLKYVAGNISNQINNVDKGLRAGIAGALASGGLYHVTTAGKSMVSVGAGTYRGQNALAVGYSRLSDNGKVGVKFTVNSNSQGHSGASASVGYQW